MLPSRGARSPFVSLAIAAVCFLVFIFGFMAWSGPPHIPFPELHGGTHVDVSHDGAPVSIQEVIRLLYSPLRLSPTESIFADENGTAYSLPPNPLYTKKLGKKVLILDLETRDLKSDSAYRNGSYDWRKIDHVSGGIFNHYAYAMVHGYDYKLIKAPQFSDRHATWIKPSAIANQIKDYQFIIFLDADATVRHMHLPIEWLLNYWQIEPRHSITMALDPWTEEVPDSNADSHNRTLTNTGFMVIQNNKVTPEILKAWHECPDDTRYPTCSEWKLPHFHEQSAFGEFIRYDYEYNIKELPCAEANGFPGVEVSQCVGKFIRHYWFEKVRVKEDFRDNLMQAFTLPIQRLFAEKSPRVIYEQTENKIF